MRRQARKTKLRWRILRTFSIVLTVSFLLTYVIFNLSMRALVDVKIT